MTFENVRYHIFGWIIHKKILEPGESYTVYAPEKLTRAKTGNVSIWTKGRVTGINKETGEEIEPRVPGMFSLERPPIHGTYEMTAQEDSEFWCMNAAINRRKLPKLKPFRLIAGEKTQVAKGTLLFICEGNVKIDDNDLAGPTSLEFSKDREVEAVNNVIGLIVGRKNV